MASTSNAPATSPDHSDFVWTERPCDHCGSAEHEAQGCKDPTSRDLMLDKLGAHCLFCGRGMHSKPDCPMVKQMKVKERTINTPFTKKELDEMTPKYRRKQLIQMPGLMIHAAATVQSATTSMGESSLSVRKSLSKSNTASTASDSAVAHPPTLTAEAAEAAQLDRWKLAEKDVAAKLKAKGSWDNKKEARANFFEIKIDSPTLDLWKYSITVRRTPKSDEMQKTKAETEKESRRIKRETKQFLINDMLTQHPPSHGNWASDYQTTIVSVGPLYKDSAYIGIDYTYSPDPVGNSKRKEYVAPFSTLIEAGKRIDMGLLQKHVQSKNVGDAMESPDDLLKLLNIISWNNITKPNPEVGRAGNKFYPQKELNNSQISRNLKNPELYFLRQGFFSSMRPGEGSVLLNVNTVTTAFLSPINLRTWMNLAWDNKTPTPARFKLRLRGVRVSLNLHNNSRTWVIDDIGPRSVSEMTFEKDKRHIRISDYLKTQYPHYKPTAEDLRSPCINLGTPVKKIWYPANELTILDWQVAKESVQTASGKSMVIEATRKPADNKEKILSDGLKILGLKPIAPIYKAFGLTPSPLLVKLDAGIVPGPKLRYSYINSKSPEIRNGGWNLAEQKSFLQPRGANELFVLSFATHTDIEKFLIPMRKLKREKDMQKIPWPPVPVDLHEAVKNLADGMVRYRMGQKIAISWIPGRNVGMKVPREDSAGSRKAWSELLASVVPPEKLQAKAIPFLLIVLPKKEIAIYQEIKHWTDCIVGIPSICVTVEKLLKVRVDQTLCANICLKINFKMKGVSHWVETGLQSAQSDCTAARPGTMIVGADVTHPGKSLDNCPSMAAVVATNDHRSGHYLGSARLQKGKQEYIADLEGMICERVLAWFEKAKNPTDVDPTKKELPKIGTQRLPQRILFYRDGVSESQYGMVLHEEKDQIMRGFERAQKILLERKELAAGTRKVVPKLTLIVVTKRHHARFYPALDTIKNSNLAPGSLVEDQVVTPYNWSFYLQSHHSELGTARSALYVVLYNDDNYDAKAIQRITNNICYNSARATKIVSVCTPARYADILCDRLRCYMRPALDGSYQIPHQGKDDSSTAASVSSPSRKSGPTSAPSSSPKHSASASLPISSTPESDEPLYVARHRGDGNVWIPTQQNDGRLNPWHPNLDNSMFYL